MTNLSAAPRGEALFSREAEELKTERTELSLRLAGLPTKYVAQHAAAVKVAAAAAEREVEAEAALQIARESLAKARHAAEVLAVRERTERFEDERELRETADPRLGEFATHCDDVAALARDAFATMPMIAGRSWLTGEKGSIVWTSNGDPIDLARAGLKAAAEDARAMQLEILGRQEITDRINRHLHALEPLLEPLRLNVMELDQHGNLSRDRTRVPAQLRKDATIASGYRAEPDDVAQPAPRAKVYRGHPSLQRAQMALDRLV